jgi:hypothetical protein
MARHNAQPSRILREDHACSVKADPWDGSYIRAHSARTLQAVQHHGAPGAPQGVFGRAVKVASAAGAPQKMFTPTSWRSALRGQPRAGCSPTRCRTRPPPEGQGARAAGSVRSDAFALEEGRRRPEAAAFRAFRPEGLPPARCWPGRLMGFNDGTAAFFIFFRAASGPSLPPFPLTLTMSSPMTMVRLESMEVDTSVQRKSTDTRGSSATASTPFMGPAAASRNAALTSSAKVFFST